MTDKPDTDDAFVVETELIGFRKSSIHGTGGFAKVSIPRGTRIIEYVGERITKAESLLRCEADNEYIFTLTDETDLDGNVDWNLARYINHSCSPNCEAEMDDEKIWIVANRDIAVGDEITFNYGFDLVDYRNYPCHCGARECVGYIVDSEFFDHVRKQKAL